jgi:hypothetical protein
MAPNALVDDMEHQDGGAFQSYSPENYSDPEMDGDRGKGANGKPRTRLGYQRISIACCNYPFILLSNMSFSILSEAKDPMSASCRGRRSMPKLCPSTTRVRRPAHRRIYPKRGPKSSKCPLNRTNVLRRSPFDDSPKPHISTSPCVQA